MKEESTELARLEEENERLRQRLTAIEEGRQRRRRAGWWFTKKAGGAFAGSWLRNSFLRLYQEIPQKNVQQETLADLSASLLWRVTRFGVIAVLLALLPTAILLFQTNLLMRQNSLLARQNFRLDQQTNLAEAERRSAMVYVMANLMDEMDNQVNREEGRLSDALIARFASLTQSLKPYRFLEEDQLTMAPLSPEKGQLFLNIVLADLNRNSRNELFQKANFNNADLKEADLHLVKVQQARLARARLTDARLFNSDWQEADLKEVNFEGAWVDGSSFEDCDLSRSRLTGSAWFDTQCQGCDLNTVVFSGAMLHRVTFTDTDLSDSRWQDAVLSGCAFNGSTSLEKADWKGAIIEDGWLQQQVANKVKGAEQVEKLYKQGEEVRLNELGIKPNYVSRFTARNPEVRFYRLEKK